MEKNDYYLIEKNAWDNMIGLVEELKKEVDRLKSERPTFKKILTNKDLQQLLCVNNKLIRKYREEGLLRCSHERGKYWYTIDDVRNFLKKTRK